MKLERASHRVYKIRYHLVIQVKYRKALLNKDLEQGVKDTFRGLTERYNIAIEEAGFVTKTIFIFLWCLASNFTDEDLHYHQINHRQESV